ncbi:TPA: glycosyltransferase family 4 protein [Burkholderia multivorans]|uniref:glycosyltransferase family 4 protein n=1 Tax=Burkholderia multivorans TaxID=87883 RepID=UPI0004F92AF8|nr:glycosyltransferase family 4 protein [Burkholderia multivorans]AIO77077.1 glycosyl transferases group 1 family protein [Burkholderia multivorans]MBU9224948.1 glycosyltransferase family 4 protein [Burkholderia multivorans]MBU9354217.1 glycosyltransferase family 4 protein [Burkholderia multivorans]MBU9391159.1 glycosyltransferase family 4 protein [Burkholderia multivorans]MBU9397421.1 glycosyltransferase family 4 protein [Burkholderia multivorans]
MKALHLSFFYPDEIEPVTTHAVKRLIECADGFAENRRVSLHMFLPDDGIRVRHGAGHVVICERLAAFPYGMRRFLTRCSALLREAVRDLHEFDLVHAHMLAMEGELALDIKKRFGVRFVASVRSTDFILFRFKPYMKRRYLEIVDAAERLILIAPWMAGALQRAFGNDWTAERAAKTVCVYNIVEGPERWKPVHNGRYVMPIVPHRSQLARKSVAATLRAIATLRRAGRSIELDIYGDGDGIDRIRRWIERYRLQHAVILKGKISNAEMIDALSDYKALFLCSKPETFGLVYVEALKAGIPVVHMAGTGIDGVFPADTIGVAACSRSIRALANAFVEMERCHAERRIAIRNLQSAGELKRFGARAVREQLHDIYARAIEPARVPVVDRTQKDVSRETA